MPRRSKIVMLPQVIGAAGVVSLSFSYSFTNRFEHRLDVLIKNPVLEPENHKSLPLPGTSSARPFTSLPTPKSAAAHSTQKKSTK